MEEYGMVPALPPPQPLAAPRRRRRWLLVGGLALAFALTLGVGALLGSALPHIAQAAYLAPGGNGAQYAFDARPGAQGRPGGPGGPGQACAALTVSSVSGQTIIAKAPDGTSVTIHTTASTTYTKAGQSATASAITAGSTIHVRGTHNSDGSITATDIDIG